jgi:hypothetical protein
MNTELNTTQLFVDLSELNINKTKLNQLNVSAYIDSSGSTSGTIMKNQITTYKKLQEYCKIIKTVSWSSSSTLLPSVNINHLSSCGGTDPSCFVRYWDNESAAIIFTDGQISVSDMERFKTTIQSKVNNIPIIIMLSVSSINNYTLSDLKRQVGIDMSIPETFLSLSNDVVIAFTDGVKTKVLMSKGEFVVFESNQLDENSVLSYLPDFDYKLLSKIELSSGLPSNFIKLEGYDKYLNLNNIATSSETNIDVLEKLCSRAI